MGPLFILGLDPGSRYTGYGLIRAGDSRLEVITHGRFSLPSSSSLALRLAKLSSELTDLITSRPPDIAVLETPFHGLNTRSLVVLAQARGVLLAVLGGQGVEIDEYSPAEIKSAVTGSGRADKQQVSRMVALQLSLPHDSLSSDAADALAVAICYAQRQRFDHLVRRGS